MYKTIKKIIFLFFLIFNSFSCTFNTKICQETVNKLYTLHKTFGNQKPKFESILSINKSSIPIEKEVLLDHEFEQIVKTQPLKSIKIDLFQISELIELIRTGKDYYNSMNDVHLDKTLELFKSKIKKVAIFGLYETSYLPWIEAVLLNLNPQAQITLIDYQPKVYQAQNIKWIHLNQFLNNYQTGQNFEQFDLIVNYMMIEKVGLGRYGEEISIDADLDTVKLINCLLAENGLVLISMSWNKYANNSYVGFNSGRLYHQDRLDQITNNFNVLSQNFYNYGSKLILIMEKKFE